MPQFRLSPQAERDIEAILAWTHEEFGEKARRRYEALLTRAVLDVAESPERAGAHSATPPRPRSERDSVATLNPDRGRRPPRRFW